VARRIRLAGTGFTERDNRYPAALGPASGRGDQHPFGKGNLTGQGGEAERTPAVKLEGE